MKSERRNRSEQGVALVVALAAAIVAFFIVIAVLNLTFNRFNLSFLEADRAAAYAASEAGVRYVFTRLEVDTTYTDPVFSAETGGSAPAPGFANAVRHAQSHSGFHGSPRAYVVSSLVAGTVTIDGTAVTPDLRTNDLFMGTLNPTRLGREVTVSIRAGINGAGQPEFRVRAFSDYGG